MKKSSRRSCSSVRSETEESVPHNKKLKEELKEKDDRNQKTGEKKKLRRERLRTKRNSKGLKIEPDSVDKIHAALNNLKKFMADIAGMTKDTHKKLLECMVTKINLNYINSKEAVLDVCDELKSTLLTLETYLGKMIKEILDNKKEVCNMLKEDLKIKVEKKEEDGENVEDSERAETSISSANIKLEESPEIKHEVSISVICSRF